MSNCQISKVDEFHVGQFKAMASPCEVIVDSTSEEVANCATQIALAEAIRIEQAFSRYREDNIVFEINNSNGRRIEVDTETANLLDFAAQCFTLSDGLFDVTSGVLRKAWTFDGSSVLPQQSELEPLLNLVGWEQVIWQNPFITMPAGMQLDFGGIGKEYAVDRTVALIRQQVSDEFLVNFGGDLHASGPPANGKPWRVGIEHMSSGGVAVSMLELSRGALTTSGDTYRYVLHDGIRYGHVLHPKTGWPVPDAPHAVSVLSDSCTEAGVLSTLAMLNGGNAEKFLDDQQVKYWCQR